MKRKLSLSNKKIRFWFVSIIIFLLGVLLHFTDVFSFLEYKSYDSRISKTASFFTPSDEITFVIVDQESIDWASSELGISWPWPRNFVGDIIRYFNIAQADAVCFDVLFTETSSYGRADDEGFAQACKEYGKVVHAIHFMEDVTEESGYTAVSPVPQLQETGAIIANVMSAKDKDDVIRRSRLSFKHEGKEYPTLGLAPLFMDSESKDLLSSIPVEKDGTIYLRYRNSIDDYIPYRAKEILQSYYQILQGEEPLLEPELFKGSKIFYGYYAPGLFDICSTPVSQVYPGVGVHLTLLDTVLNGDFIRKVPAWLTIIFLAFVSCLGSAVVFLGDSISTKHGILVTSILFVVQLIILILISYVVFIPGWWLPFVAPLTCYGLSFAVSLLISYATEGKQKKYLKTAFRQYLSPEVIEELIANPDRLKLGGERREISIYFSDLQGFTSISEKLSPEDLTGLLNEYLSEMSDIILQYGGTIDKYEGDAIIAFWNAPTAQENHGLRALEAAVVCQQRLAEMRGKLAIRAGCPMYMRIGLNTGTAVVGNMGSRNRFNYTMLGDAVNLAARLEGLNKQFGTYIMCTRATKESAEKYGTSLKFRELAEVTVVGKKEAVNIFEPMTVSEYEQRKDDIDIFQKGLLAFREGDFSAAISFFTSIASRDPVAKKYIEKCQDLEANPPENWDGIWKSTEK